MSSAQPMSVGIVAPPPVLYLGALLIGFIVQVTAPEPMVSSIFALRVLGVLLLVASGAFARWAFVTMRQTGTSANPREPSLELVTSRPFRLSRNPIYLAMIGL